MSRKYRLQKTWCDYTADYIYYLYEKNSMGWSYKDGNTNMHGDVKWARRMAKHYKITMPTKELTL